MRILFRSIHVPQQRLYPSITLVYPILQIYQSVLNVDANEFIPFSTSNSDNLIDNEILRLGPPLLHVSLSPLIIKSSVFAEVHHNKITHKDEIKKIKHKYISIKLFWHLNINSIRNKFQCLKHIVGI